ncbi:hypothetical protein pb186bvf_020740 [Paramecium bursaria]
MNKKSYIIILDFFQFISLQVQGMYFYLTLGIIFLNLIQENYLTFINFCHYVEFNDNFLLVTHVNQS